MEAFGTFDMHNGGYMALSELLHLMKSLGEGLSSDTLDQIKAAAEPDSDGQVRKKGNLPITNFYLVMFIRFFVSY